MSHRSKIRAQTLRVVFVIVPFFLDPGVLQAATLEVDAQGGTPYQTIQSAIDAAIPGVDDVRVRCGSYPENVVMVDGVSLRGSGAACTVIDGGQNGSVVTLSGLSSTTVLEGFTITNGRAPLGGGLFIEGGAPVVRENVIAGNFAIVDGDFSGNGGGIHIMEPLYAEKGGAVTTITRNVIRDNHAELFGGGMEICLDSFPVVSGNLITGNGAVEAGGGIDVFANSAPDIVGNTIARNCLEAGEACSDGGGGISIVNSGARIASNVIVWNEAGTGAGVDLIGSTATFEANDTFGNLPGNYGGVADPTGSNGNISTDPLFADERSIRYGFAPRSDSPLLDTGSATGVPALDLRGISRPRDGDGDGVPLVDIGARENEGVTRVNFNAPDDVLWDAAVDPSASFNVYRGDLQILKETGEYTQDETAVDGARQWCAHGTASLVDTDVPFSGQGLFYLVVLEATVEGSLGFDSLLQERPFMEANRCP